MKKVLFFILMISLGFAQVLAAKELVEQEPFVYNDAGKRDPFWPLVSITGAIITYGEVELSASDMTLTGIMTGSDGDNIAVLNGKIVKEGDLIGAFKVEKVTSVYVTLGDGTRKIELYLRKEE